MLKQYAELQIDKKYHKNLKVQIKRQKNHRVKSIWNNIAGIILKLILPAITINFIKEIPKKNLFFATLRKLENLKNI